MEEAQHEKIMITVAILQEGSKYFAETKHCIILCVVKHTAKFKFRKKFILNMINDKLL